MEKHHLPPQMPLNCVRFSAAANTHVQRCQQTPFAVVTAKLEAQCSELSTRSPSLHLLMSDGLVHCCSESAAKGTP